MKTQRNVTGKFVIAALTFSILGATIPAFAAQEAKPAITAATLPTIHVSGTGEVTVTPDIARITVGVQTRGKDSAQAASENAQKTDAVLKAVKALGVAEKDIQTTDYSIFPQFDYAKQPVVLTDYQVSNSVRITVRKMGDAGKILDAALKAGANIAGGISFELSDPQKARDEALAKAVADATRKATLMWKVIPINDEIRKIRPLRLMELTEGNADGNPPPMPMARMAMTDGAVANTPVQAGEMKITATISARFVYGIGD
ncbi:MAG: SIMPL domain-containing protein [Fibrella sp.]|nr:SIMPL domain-containing protein [Armatimonadota bacterium]